MFTRLRPGVAVILLTAAAATLPVALASRQTRPIDFVPGDALAWRPLGPFRAGPITAVAGDPSRHGVFYAGSAGAGLWKTTDFGAHWRPVFDAPPLGSVTAIAVAAAAPDVLYAAARTAGSGATLHRSTDGGTTWSQVGLSTRQPVTHVTLDPSDARRVFVTVRAATPGDATHGIFRSTDAGVTFERILRTSGDDVGAGVFVHPRQTAHLIAIGMGDAATSAVLHSADGGSTWQPARGLPAVDARNLRADVAAAPGDTTFLVLASSTSAALFRSTDAGASWTVVNDGLPIDVRSVARPRLSVTSDGVLLLAAGLLFESRDAGRSFTPTAPPAGHDVDLLWTHPTMAGVRLLAGATGAVVTVNGGETWSAADALTAAVVDRVSVDMAFPYRICATGERDVWCAPARGDDAARPPGAWQSLPRELAGPVVADPLDAEIVFGGAGLRHDRRTGQTLNVEPSALPGSPSERALPLAFSADGRTLFAGARAVWRTVNGGLAWTAVSPDLATSSQRMSALTVSPIDARTLWAGLDDGRVFVTRSAGGEWVEAQRPSNAAGASVRWLEPSRFDTNSAYAVLTYEGPMGDRPLPRLLRTRDSGATWTDVGARIENPGAIHVVREDPFRRGLLFAGTDRSLFVSFDDGERWQRVALNLPATPVRDLVIKDADLIVATAGRGVWMLDDISPLRQVTADVLRADLFLFRPAQVWRVRATGDRAPAAGVAGHGAMLTYQLGQPAQDAVTLEVIETTTGDVIRRWTPLPAAAGLHRVAWDLRYPPPVPGAAGATPGTLVLPGTYQVRLTVDGRSVRQAITVRMDPRIRTSIVDLTAQRDLGRALDAARAAVAAARDATPAPAQGGVSDALAGAPAGEAGTLAALADELDRLARAVQQADVKPAQRLESAIEGALTRVSMALGVDTR
jgi:photosystem II stability/assembly factor-like uncharacterized protein